MRDPQIGCTFTLLERIEEEDWREGVRFSKRGQKRYTAKTLFGDDVSALAH